MNVYIYQAALYCEPCGEAIALGLTPSSDSDSFPQGPYGDGGGEADQPQHCDSCGVHLENPLTADGEAYVSEAIAEIDARPDGKHGAVAVIADWRAFYSYLWP